MSTVRLRRLTADNVKLQDYVRRHPRIRIIQADGNPPERYQLEYRIKSLKKVGVDLQVVQSHVVEIMLPLNYPRTPPQCRMLSPVFHPNIAPHAICVGDHWGAGESLESIVIRIGEMLAYQSYNVKSPLNGEAARWVEQNKQQLPLDTVSLLPEEEQSETADLPISDDEIQAKAAMQSTIAIPAAAQVKPVETADPHGASAGAELGTNPPASEISAIRVSCDHCGTLYNVSASLAGKNVRCRTCGESFRCEAINPISQDSA